MRKSAKVWPRYLSELQPENYAPFDIARAGINLLRSASLAAFDPIAEKFLNNVGGFEACPETSFPRHRKHTIRRALKSQFWPPRIT
jgi:hypothetical protein